MQKKHGIILVIAVLVVVIASVVVKNSSSEKMQSHQKDFPVQKAVDLSEPRPYVNPEPKVVEDDFPNFEEFNRIDDRQFNRLFSSEIGEYKIADNTYLIHRSEINKLPNDAKIIGRRGEFVFFTLKSKVRFFKHPVMFQRDFGAYTGKISIIASTVNNAQVINFIGNYGKFKRVTIYGNVIIIECPDVLKAAKFVEDFKHQIGDAKITLDIFSKLPRK